MFSRFLLCKPHILLSFLSLYLFHKWSLILTAEEYCSIFILHTPCINTNSRSLMYRTTAVVSCICVSVLLWEWNKYACAVHPRFTAPPPFLKWNIYDPCRSMYKTHLSQHHYHPSNHTLKNTSLCSVLYIILLQKSRTSLLQTSLNFYMFHLRLIFLLTFIVAIQNAPWPSVLPV